MIKHPLILQLQAECLTKYPIKDTCEEDSKRQSFNYEKLKLSAKSMVLIKSAAVRHKPMHGILHHHTSQPDERLYYMDYIVFDEKSNVLPVKKEATAWVSPECLEWRHQGYELYWLLASKERYEKYYKTK